MTFNREWLGPVTTIELQNGNILKILSRKHYEMIDDNNLRCCNCGYESWYLKLAGGKVACSECGLIYTYSNDLLEARAEVTRDEKYVWNPHLSKAEITKYYFENIYGKVMEEKNQLMNVTRKPVIRGAASEVKTTKTHPVNSKTVEKLRSYLKSKSSDSKVVAIELRHRKGIDSIYRVYENGSKRMAANNVDQTVSRILADSLAVHFNVGITGD